MEHTILHQLNIWREANENAKQSVTQSCLLNLQLGFNYRPTVSPIVQICLGFRRLKIGLKPISLLINRLELVNQIVELHRLQSMWLTPEHLAGQLIVQMFVFQNMGLMIFVCHKRIIGEKVICIYLLQYLILIKLLDSLDLKHTLLDK